MLDIIKKIVENHYQIKDISIRNRKEKFVEARAIYGIVARQNTDFGYCQIGKKINRDHATILHYNKKIYDSWISFPKLNIKKLQTIKIIYNNFIEQNSQPAEFYNIAIDNKSSNEKQSISKIFRKRRYSPK